MQDLMITLLVCSVTTSALALLYMAITPLLAKRYSAVGLYYAWLVFVIGLIVPFRPHLGNAMVKVDLPVSGAAPVVRAGNGAAVTALPNALPSTALHVTWWHIAAAVWLLGMAAFLAFHIIKHNRFLRWTARWSETITDGQILTLFQTLKAQMGISQTIGLQICDSIGSPMLIGFIRPRILLPGAGYAQEELRLILKHELVHYKRRDLWYKGLVLAAAAVHWFNPCVHLMAKAIAIQCELSCDAQVVRNARADTRLYYSETIIRAVRYSSKLKTAFSTNFYGGKKNMKTRIFSIMDMSRKKTGAAVLCGALILTLGTGFTFAASAANTEPQNQGIGADQPIKVTPWIAVDVAPSTGAYAPYAGFGITVSDDGEKLLCQGQPIRQFVDEKADGWAFYLDEAGNGDWSAVRNAGGELTGIERISPQKAQEYYEGFFAEELSGSSPEAQDIAAVQEGVQDGPDKYEQYAPFGLTCSATDGGLYYNENRVKFLIDQPEGAGPEVFWTDAAGTVNVAAVRNHSGQLTGIERIPDEKAQEYNSAAEEYAQNSLKGLEERVEARVKALYPEN
ncbi:MAG: M56 family metallopeptidase [Enterocloster asparagiformis]|nr:M56 family metallopeptidase [Enterocloster asparagiformis]